MKKYREMKLYDDKGEDLDVTVSRVLEEKRKERELQALLEAEKAAVPSPETVLAMEG